eukprot:542848-Amphidinium_carterae.1
MCADLGVGAQCPQSTPCLMSPTPHVSNGSPGFVRSPYPVGCAQSPENLQENNRYASSRPVMCAGQTPSVTGPTSLQVEPSNSLLSEFRSLLGESSVNANASHTCAHACGQLARFGLES